ncbi:MAG: YihY/virulence factor BrkB family protein [Solirubrobacteraceae bacterium]|nr:YihY/virulence factor BrkB family protein [Solirubrobacteraceae bacterium]
MTHRTGEAPDDPTELQASSWWATLKRTRREFSDDALTVWAAALTYYAVLAIFPALLALVSILGLIGESVTQPMIDNLATVTPGPAKDIVVDTLRNLQDSRGTAGVAFVVGLGGAIWSASGYVGGFMRASNAIYEMDEGRPIWRTIPVRVGTTVVLLLTMAAVAIAVVVTGPLADEVGRLVGIGDTAVTVWDIAKWPVVLVVVMVMFAFLYWAAPNVEHPRFPWVSPGGVVAVLSWIAVSALFALYVTNFASYDKTYGSLGGVIAFLVWLWLTNIAILFGAELNAELERSRQIEAGLPATTEPFLEPRDTRAMDEDERRRVEHAPVRPVEDASDAVADGPGADPGPGDNRPA